MVLYHHADVFTANVRQALYGTFLVDNHFFYFFLHWDINVRNAYHQLLVFKVIHSLNI